jgi:uncharacterized protein (TIGR02145 family)
MKTFLKTSTVIVLLLGLILIVHSCKKEKEVPVLSTTPVTNITATTATSGGSITSDGGAVITASGVCWGTATNPAILDSKTTDGTATGQFVSEITGLTAGATYHVRAYATNSVGTAYGADVQFSTLGQVPASVTLAATNISTTGATLNGTVNPNYLSTTVTFEYGTTTSYGQTVTATQSPVTGNNTANVSADITELTIGTTYHFRVKTINSLGTVYGADMSFVTSGQAPTSVTQPATNISGTGATLNGTVNANYLSTTVTFEYGTTISYGSNVTATQSPLTGNTATSVSGSITGLTLGTTYHFRVKAANSLGTVYGSDLTFKTLNTPTLSTITPSSITHNAASSGGTITSDGGSSITAKGVCWSTTANPTIALSTKTTDGTGTGSFTSDISGLTDGTVFYVRAYATNQAGTAYGSEVQLLTKVVDADNNLYNTVVIGTRVWMAENLKTTTFKDGITGIPNVTDPVAWNALTGPGYCWYNNIEATYKPLYGALYNWFTVSTGNLCPTGWHVPTDAEWQTLIDYLGGWEVAGGKLKEEGTTHWQTPNAGATNETGFTALPGGWRYDNGEFVGFAGNSLFWSSSKALTNTTHAWGIGIYYYNGGLDLDISYKNYGFSVRCLKD